MRWTFQKYIFFKKILEIFRNLITFCKTIFSKTSKTVTVPAPSAPDLVKTPKNFPNPNFSYVIYVILRDLRDFPGSANTVLYVIYVILRGTYIRETLTDPGGTPL